MRRIRPRNRKGLVWPNTTLGDGFLFAAVPTVGEKEQIEPEFERYVVEMYRRNGIIFACILARMWVFSEARFQFQRFEGGRPGDLFGNPSLRIVEQPWENGTTGELLMHMEQDASLAGNCFITRVTDSNGDRLRRLRPDWVTILTGSPSGNPYDIRARPVGYIYDDQRGNPVMLPAEQVAHYTPIPDPLAQWRGMSWINPLIREIEADTAAVKHKAKFFRNGATTNFVVSYDKTLTKDQFEAYVRAFRQSHEGVDNAYKTIHLGGGADVNVVGADLKQLDFKATQGSGETRIAAAAGVHPVIVGLSEGLAGSSLNAGNFNSARRLFADKTLRPLWRNAAAALAKFVDVPPVTRLWYDDRDIPFLRDDQQDVAEIQQKEASTIASLTREGYKWETVVDAVKSNDWSLLDHTGLYSVQLQPLTTDEDDTDDEPSTEPTPAEPTANGNRPALPVAT